MIGSGPGSYDDVEAPQRAQDVQATFCATLIDQWIRQGIVHAVVAPGSRSTPMAVALATRSDMSVHVVHDERSAAFVALGLGIDGVPALLLCTSGTAAANFLPAVAEAGLSEIPMLVLTADRPEELRGVGAPQTIDQLNLYGSHVRWFHDPGVPVWSTRDTWRSLAATVVERSATGPVHLNLPFREPLLGVAAGLPEPTQDPVEIDAGSAATRLPIGELKASAIWSRGLILAGGRSGVADAEVARLAERTGWPILADPLSGLRHLDGVVTHFESMLRSDSFAGAHRPAVVVRLGRPATSKTLAQWIDRCVEEIDTVLVQVGGPGLIDPGRNVTSVCSIDDVLAADHAASDPMWASSWTRGELVASGAVVAQLDAEFQLSEPGAARTVAEQLPTNAGLVVASSMPVRDLEWFGGTSARAYCNRGANGIDGVTSTGLGVALSGSPTVVLIGDLAFAHDTNALLGLVSRGVDLRIVVVDNDGGGIFSFLPQASVLDETRFEQLFGTPLGVDVLALASAHGIPTSTATTSAELAAQLVQTGPWVARVPSTRSGNVEVHDALHDAVRTALDFDASSGPRRA